MKSHFFSATELTFLIFHSICFLAALFFSLNGFFPLCLFFILLLGLSLPVFLLTKKAPDNSASLADEETISYSEPETIPVPDIPIHNITQDTVHPSDQIKDRLPETLSVLPDCQTEEPVTLNLISFCETMVQEFIHLYGLFPSQVQILSEEKSILLSTKKTLLTLIIQNLIDNAAKYVKYDSRHAARFTLTLSKQDSAIIMIFRNNTCGVSPAEIPNLTTRNYQGSNRISGTGLGLFQAEAAVNILQGSLQIKSSPGTGFAVYLQLPELTGHPENSLSKKEDTNETA